MKKTLKFAWKFLALICLSPLFLIMGLATTGTLAYRWLKYGGAINIHDARTPQHLQSVTRAFTSQYEGISPKDLKKTGFTEVDVNTWEYKGFKVVHSEFKNTIFFLELQMELKDTFQLVPILTHIDLLVENGITSKDANWIILED